MATSNFKHGRTSPTSRGLPTPPATHQNTPILMSAAASSSAAEIDAKSLEAAAADAMDDEEVEVSGGKRRKGTGGESVEIPQFEPLTAKEAAGKTEFRRIPVPPHRFSPLKKEWMSIYSPIVEHLKLDVRMNPRNRCVEIKTSQHTQDIDHLQKAADFVRAYMLGFEVSDAVALLRMEDLYVDSFMITDVKMLKGDHLSRAIGRVAGKDGKCKNSIENATRTRIVLAEAHIHILGAFAHIKAARDACCNLILGSPPSKVATSLRAVSSRLGQRI